MTAGRSSSWRAAGAGLAAVVLVVASFVSLDLHWAELLAPGARTTMGEFVAGFFPPQLESAFLRRTATATLETLAMSLLGTLLAAGVGALLALPAAGRGWARALARLGLNALRSVPELVWAALLLVAAGLGPLPGTLALALHTTGVLGRLFAEALENSSPAPADALAGAGAPALATFCYGTLPLVAPQWLAYALYRWEMNIRMAAILGFVGAGGLGALLYYSLSLFQEAQASTVIIAMLAMAVAVDGASAWLRRRAGA